MIGTKEEREADWQARQARAREEERLQAERMRRAIEKRDAEVRAMEAVYDSLPGSSSPWLRNCFVNGEFSSCSLRTASF